MNNLLGVTEKTYFRLFILVNFYQVWGLTIHDELACYPKEHGKSTYFKYGTQGVALIRVPCPGQIYSCGGDGTLKWRQISLRDTIVNTKIT